MMKFDIKDTFNLELPADKITDNHRRQVYNACFSLVTPRVPSHPQLLHYSEEMAQSLGLSTEDVADISFLEVFSGKKVLENTRPFAMCYGGHQFGNWAGQLGDGRAINLFEVEYKQKHWALQLKGAGETPYSRTADGLAVLRSSIREHLCSEAMYHLGVPTTRSLSLILSGDEVLRDVMYNGNPAYEKGAIVCRVAPSFLRFGNFQIFAARQDIESLKQLTDYTITHFFPEIQLGSKESYIAFFKKVADLTLEMIIHWQRVGFVHGVMNTDNMSILGLTIDFGPYGWLEDFNPNWTPNTTDRQEKRYRFCNQPNISLWNLIQLANALYPLVGETEPFEGILSAYNDNFNEQYLQMMRSKIGLAIEDENDIFLLAELEKMLQNTETDMTIFFRKLSEVSKNANNISTEFEKIKFAFYEIEEVKDVILEKWHNWFERYINRLQSETDSDEVRKMKMNTVNPKYVLRNYMAQLAIDAADKGDYSIIQELYTLLKNPYSDQPTAEKWFAKRPDWARQKIGCSMLSCSS